MSGVLLPFRNVLPRVAPDAFVLGNAVVIGDVEIAAGANIWFGCVLRGDIAPIRVGQYANIQDGTVVHRDRFTLDQAGAALDLTLPAGAVWKS